MISADSVDLNLARIGLCLMLSDCPSRTTRPRHTFLSVHTGSLLTGPNLLNLGVKSSAESESRARLFNLLGSPSKYHKLYASITHTTVQMFI
jgi:hypothetical protein